MATNIDRLKQDLDRLLELGGRLELGMLVDLHGKEEIRKTILPKFSDADAKKLLDGIPNFKKSYDEWYSESIAVIKQLLPDRLDDFRSLYEKPKGRKSIEYGNYVIQDFMQDLAVTYGGRTKVDRGAALPQYQQQLAILRSTKRRFESSLFEMRQLVQADLFDSEIDVARELLKNKFFRAAGVVAGVVVERHLKQVCDDHGIKVTKAKPGIAVLNQALRDANVIDIPQWRFNKHLADLRNLCSHSKTDDPTKEQVQDLIDGAEKVLKTIA